MTLVKKINDGGSGPARDNEPFAGKEKAILDSKFTPNTSKRGKLPRAFFVAIHHCPSKSLIFVIQILLDQRKRWISRSNAKDCDFGAGVRREIRSTAQCTGDQMCFSIFPFDLEIKHGQLFSNTLQSSVL